MPDLTTSVWDWVSPKDQCWDPAYSWHTSTTWQTVSSPSRLFMDHLVLPHQLCSKFCRPTRPPQAGAVGKRMGDVLLPGQIQLTANHQEQEDQPSTSRLHPPRSDPGDSPLSQAVGCDTAVWPRMRKSHWQHLCQGKQDARLPQKKLESLLSQDQGPYLQGTDPTHHWVRITLRAPLSSTFLQTLPDLVTSLKGYSLSPCICPPMHSAPSKRFGYW